MPSPGRIPSSLLAWFVVSLALLIAPTVRGVTYQQEMVTVYFSTTNVGGVERFEALQQVTPRNATSADLESAVGWVLAGINLPPNWSTTDPDFTLAQFPTYLNQAIVCTYGAQLVAIVPAVGPDPTTHLYALTIGLKMPTVIFTGVKLTISTWALAPGTPTIQYYVGNPDQADELATRFPSARARLAQEKAAGLAGHPKSLTQFLLKSEIDLVPKDARLLTGSSPLALQHLEASCGETLVVACAAAASDCSSPTGVTALRTKLNAEWQRIVGTSEAPPSTPTIYAPQGTVLPVTLPDVDPILAARVVAPNIVMPASFGGKLSWPAFSARYGKYGYGRDIERTWAGFTAGLGRTLATTDGLAPDSFPRFIDDAARQRVAARLATDPHVNLCGIVPPSADAAAAPGVPAYAQTYARTGELVYSADYRPGQFGFTLQAQADTSHQLTGSVSLDYSLANDQDLSVSGSIGTTSLLGSASYTQPRLQLGSLASLLFIHSVSFDREQDMRLGTATGPLVTTRNLQAGPAAQLNSSIMLSAAPGRQRQFLYRVGATVYYRNLGGSGPAAFLQPAPAALHGPAASATLSFDYQDAVAPTAATPAGPAAAASGSLWSPVEFDASAALAVTPFFPSSRSGYTSITLQATALEFFGSAATGTRRAYLQAKASAGVLGDAAPRLDFLRLGGQDTSPGLDDGELAGRTSWNAGLEGGWRLASLIPSLGSGGASLLDQAYLNLFTQYGGVGRQSGAGTDFNSHRTAFTVGAGARLFGVAGGAAGGSSLSLGYAWSPQSIRRAGRFYASISLPFPP